MDAADTIEERMEAWKDMDGADDTMGETCTADALSVSSHQNRGLFCWLLALRSPPPENGRFSTMKSTIPRNHLPRFASCLESTRPTDLMPLLRLLPTQVVLQLELGGESPSKAPGGEKEGRTTLHSMQAVLSTRGPHFMLHGTGEC